jgi:hypothetical protein
VNHYPHAFWWTVQEDGMSWIDHHWGNLSAEIIGYLSHYKSKVKKLNVDKLLDQAINHLLQLKNFESEHEIYCYLRMFKLLFVHSPFSETFDIPSEEININLDYFIEQLENDGKISLNWKWNDYFDVWGTCQSRMDWGTNS